MVMSNRGDQVCIVGFGCCTAVGNDAPSTIAAVRAGIAGFKEHPFMINQDGTPYILAMAPAVDPSVIGEQRMMDLAVRSACEACQPLQMNGVENVKLSVRVGLPERRPGAEVTLEHVVSDALSSCLEDIVGRLEIEVVPKGHAAGLMAIGAAARTLRHGEAEFCLAGGVDSYIDPDTLDWVEDNEQLHKPDNAWGFIPGEAAAFCLLSTETTARSYNLSVLSQLVGVATAIEHNRIKTETVCIGEGLTEAVAGVLSHIPKDRRIRYAYCDQNGETYRADEFGFMLSRLSQRFENTDAYMAPADCWGDVGAASGPLFVGLHAKAAEKGSLAGELSLIWACSEGGERSASIFESPLNELRRNS